MRVTFEAGPFQKIFRLLHVCNLLKHHAVPSSIVQSDENMFAFVFVCTIVPLQSYCNHMKYQVCR